MGTSELLSGLLDDLSEENYEQTVSEYRFWMKFGVTHGWIRDDLLFDDIWNRMYTDLVYPTSDRLIHPTAHLLIRFIADVGLDPALSAYVSSTHDRLCRVSLEGSVDNNLSFMSGNRWHDNRLGRFYTNVNILAHHINLGYLNLEDVRDRILQSLAFHPTVHPHQFNSLVILLKISGATFAAYVDPSVMERCCDLLKPSNSRGKPVFTGLAEVRTLILTIKTSYKC